MLGMTIRVNDPAMPHLPDEKSVVLRDREGRICIHPWLYGTGTQGRNSSEVCVTLGRLNKEGQPKGDKEGQPKGYKDFEISIFDRADFIEALLAVFPELVRR